MGHPDHRRQRIHARSPRPDAAGADARSGQAVAGTAGAERGVSAHEAAAAGESVRGSADRAVVKDHNIRSDLEAVSLKSEAASKHEKYGGADSMSLSQPRFLKT